VLGPPRSVKVQCWKSFSSFLSRKGVADASCDWDESGAVPLFSNCRNGPGNLGSGILLAAGNPGENGGAGIGDLGRFDRRRRLAASGLRGRWLLKKTHSR